jgi:hypothetical protein
MKPAYERCPVEKVPLKAPEAADAASGLAKVGSLLGEHSGCAHVGFALSWHVPLLPFQELYSRLFDHLVQQINFSTSAALDVVHRTIALLDIFGFEMFKVNSFEV